MIYLDEKGNKYVLVAHRRRPDGTIEYPKPGKRALRQYLPKNAQ